MPKTPKSVGVLTTDRKLMIRSWDRWLTEATGIPAETACGQPLETFAPDLAERGLLGRIQRVLEDGAVEVLAPAFHRFLIPCPPREQTPHFAHMQQHVIISPLREEGAVTGVVITLEDVTARLQRERELAAQLRSDDDAIRLRAARALADEAAPDVLIEAFADSSWRVRRAAVEGFRSRTGDAAVVALTQALRDQHRHFSVLNATLSALAVAGGDVIPALAEALADDDTDVRIYAALALGYLADERAVPPLMTALDDPDPNVKYHALEALGRLASPAAADRVAEIATSGDFFLAFPALDALARIGESRVAPHLLPLLGEAPLAAAAAEALAVLGAEEAVAPIAALLDSPDVPAATVAGALATLYRRFDEAYGEGALIADLARAAIGPQQAQPLVAALPQAGDRELADVALVLGWLDFAGVERALASLLAHPRARGPALDALVRRGRRAVEVLIGELGDDETGQAAAAALGRIGSPTAVPALVGLLSATPEVAIVAASALGSIGDARAFEPLLALLGHDEPAVRQAAVAALNSIGHPDLLERVQQLLRHEVPGVRESAARIAGYFGYEECVDSMLRLCGDDDPGVRRVAIEHLAFFRDPRVPAAIASALKDRNPAARAAAARAAAHLRGQDVVEALLAALRDPNLWVRYYAARSAASHPVAVLVEPLCEVAVADPAPPVRIAAIEALGAIGDARAVGPLAAAVSSGDAEVAGAALSALGRVGTSAAVPHLVDAVRSPHATLRLAALVALRRSPLAATLVPDITRAAGAATEPEVARAAIDLLAHVGSPEAVAALVDLARDRARRSACIAALARVREERIETVGEGLRHTDHEVRSAVVEALARLKHPSASRLLATALDDPDPNVRLAAAHALSRMDLRSADRRLTATGGGSVVRRPPRDALVR